MHAASPIIKGVYFPLNLMSYSDQQNVAEVTLCWCQAWALRGMVGFSFAFLEVLRCHVKKSDHLLERGEEGHVKRKTL